MYMTSSSPSKIDSTANDDASNTVVHFNVSGKKLITTRKILTLIEGTLLSTIFLERSNEMFAKDADDVYFCDFDPMLFKHLINQLRYWSLNPLVPRVFSVPVNQGNEFISFVRCLRFREEFLSDTFSQIVNANVQIVDHQRLCIKTGQDQHCAYVVGNLLYYQGKHSIKLMIFLSKGQIGFVGIRPAQCPIEIQSTKNSSLIAHTFGIDNSYPIINGKRISHVVAWSITSSDNIIYLELDCDSRTMLITLNQYRCSTDLPSTRLIDLTNAELPWQLFIVLRNKDDYVRLMV